MSTTVSCNEFIYLRCAWKNAYSLLTSISPGDSLDLAPSIYIFNYLCFTVPSPCLHFLDIPCI